MAAPTVTAIYPNNSATSIPIGANIEITLSTGIDLSTAIKNIVLYGRDFDMISGPETTTWLKKDGTSQDFLDSPGFKGVVQCDYRMVYLNSQGAEASLTPKAVAEESGYTQKIIISPKTFLHPEVEYTVYIIGEDTEGTSRGLSGRTVYEVDASAATSTTAGLTVYGGYTGSSSDTISIKITKAGNIGTAEYKWWYSQGEVEGDARLGKVTSRRYRKLEDEAQVRFTGSGFILDDIYTVNVYPKQLLAASNQFSFTTSSTQITSVPLTASTSVIGTTTTVASSTSYLQVSSMAPADGSSHQKFAKKQIEIEFSAALDSDTVTDATVTVLAYPISGVITSAEDEKELFKKLTVSGTKLTIDL